MARLQSDIRTDTRMPAEPEPVAVGMQADTPRGVALSRKQVTSLVVLLLALVATSGWLGYKVYSNGQDPQEVVAAQNQALVAQVGNLIVLPEGEEPTVATVNDLAPLKDQAFFDNAKIGDKVLIYTNARKAILYNPDTNKIVEVAPVNIGDQTQGQTSTPTPKDTE